MSEEIRIDSPDVRLLIDAAECVSFDLFDTLVRRDGIFFAKDVFGVVEERAMAKVGAKMSGFAIRREEAEHAARAEALRKDDSETTLEEIYAALGRRMLLSKHELSLLRNLELDCEREVLKQDEHGFALYDYALSKGRKVLIATDTYLDEAFIKDICNRLGYGEAALYVSSAHREAKYNGTLFDRIIRDTGLPPSQLLHLGDNPLSDISVPLSKGIRTSLYLSDKQLFQRRLRIQAKKSGPPSVSRILCEISDALKPKSDVNVTDRLGICVAFLLLGFTLWLEGQLRAMGTGKVYFLARDGFILKRFFDLLVRHRGKDVETRYLLVSRASLYPSLIFSDAATALELFGRSWDKITVGEAVARLALSIDESRVALERHGFNCAGDRLHSANIGHFRAFMVESWDIVKRSNWQRYLDAVDYLKQEEFLTREGAVVVDLGWNLTLQRCLSKLTEKVGVEKSIQGRYMGIFRVGFTELDGCAKGFLINHDKPAIISDMIRSSPSLIELLHGADHGTVLGYKNLDGKVMPALELNETERDQHFAIIQPIQSAALRYFSDWMPSFKEGGPSIDPELCAAVGLRMIHSPSADEAALLGALKLASDFGGRMKSITGASEWNLGTTTGELLPDGTMPMWRPGFEALRTAHSRDGR